MDIREPTPFASSLDMNYDISKSPSLVILQSQYSQHLVWWPISATGGVASNSIGRPKLKENGKANGTHTAEQVYG